MLGMFTELNMRSIALRWLSRFRVFRRFQKSEVTLIEDADLTNLLKEIDRWDDLVSGRLLCAHCNKVLTYENFSAFVVEGNEYRFLCNSQICLGSAGQP